MSFAECTATSTRPASSASSSSLTKTPRAPSSPNGLVRSRSPVVVIGTSAIWTPGRRSWAAACSAWVSASLLPRDPTLRTVIVSEAEEVLDRLDVRHAVGRRCGFLHPHGRQMEQLVDDRRRDRLDCSAIAVREPRQPPLGLRQLTGADLLCPRAQ